jgi:hypothetical protein
MGEPEFASGLSVARDASSARESLSGSTDWLKNQALPKIVAIAREQTTRRVSLFMK